MSLHSIITEIPKAEMVLADMQLNGAPPEAGRPLEARIANELIVSEARRYLQDSSPTNQEELLAIIEKISNRILLKKNLQALIKANFDQGSKTFSPEIQDKLSRFGVELSKIIECRAPKLLALGFTPKQLGNALVKLNFDQLESCFLNDLFIKDGQIETSKVDAILNPKEPLILYQRLLDTYQIKGLEPLAVYQRIVLVQSQELSEERLAVAQKMIKLGFSSSLVTEYALANKEARAWFNEKITEQCFSSNPTALIRLAKVEPEQRVKDLQKVINFINHGATATDAIGIVLNKETTERILMVFEIALNVGLNSTAALDFANSAKGQNSPNSRISLVKTLKELPLGFSDDHIVALITGGQKRYQPKKSKDQPLLSEAEKLKNSLTELVYNRFKIERKYPEVYETRRILARLDAVEIINLYKVFFNSRELPDLMKISQHPNGLYSFIDDLLMNEATYDKQSFRRVCRQYESFINQPEKHTTRNTSPDFQEFNNHLSNLILSIDPDTRYQAKLIFHSWLVGVAKEYFKKAIEVSPEVVEKLIDSTINHYDPLRLKLEGRKPVSIIKSFSFTMKQFYHHLIEHKLKETPGGFRAYVQFSRMKTKAKTDNDSRSDSKLWEQLKAEQPNNEFAIQRAQAVYLEVKNIYKPDSNHTPQ